MTTTIFLVIISAVVFSIEIYSEIHLKNYGTFVERIVYLLSIKTLFNILKFSCLYSFIYIILDLKFIYQLPELINLNIININWRNSYLYFLMPIIYALFTILSNSQELFRQLQGYYIQNEKLNRLVANFKYIIFRFISFCLTFFIFKYIFEYMSLLHEYFILKNLYIFDWLVVESNSVDNYNKGVYLSLTLTIIIFFLFNNSFIKKNSDYWRFREISFDFFKYFFITLILGLGMFFGLFSVFNGFHNLVNTGISAWISKENILGILPIRISSILILIYLSSYIYSEVLNKQFFHFLVLGILPYRKISKYYSSINFEKRETLFFSQIGFYILNIALAELFIIIGYKSVYLSILNFAILFILDDFKIINDYSDGLRKVMPFHFWRIWLFNLLMLVVAIILLTKKEYYYVLAIYILFSFILFRYYFRNSTLINIRKLI